MPDQTINREYYVGVDLGGTKILAGVFKPSLECVGRSKMSTKPNRGPKGVIERLRHCIIDAIDECDLALDQVCGIGIGAPGPVDAETGIVIVAPNLGWENVPLKANLEEQLGLPVFVENDCSACTLGIYETELECKPRHLLGIYLGTGIGGGLIIDGKLFTGFNKTAGEIGHMVLDVNGPKCGCGNRGCFEAFASRSAIFRQIETAVNDGQQTVLTDMLGPELTDLRSGDLRKAIKRGDKFVQGIVREAARYTGVAVANLINVFNPEIVVLGGGIIAALQNEMMDIIVKTANEYALAGTAKGIEIIPSKLGDDAGIVGAAVLARMKTRCDSTLAN